MSKPLIHPTAIIDSKAVLGDGVRVGPYSVINEGVTLGANTVVGAHCVIGEEGMAERGPTSIGANSIIRAGAIIYAGVQAGNRLECGPRVFIRENSQIGENFRVGTLSDIEGDCTIGNYCRFHSNVHVAKGTMISDFVWLFPYVVFTNDPHPPSEKIYGSKVDRFAVVASSSVILPGVHIGEDAVVGAMSLVRANVPRGKLVVGNPAVEICDAKLMRNKADIGQLVYPWRYHYDKGMPWEGIGYDEWNKNQ